MKPVQPVWCWSWTQTWSWWGYCRSHLAEPSGRRWLSVWVTKPVSLICPWWEEKNKIKTNTVFSQVSHTFYFSMSPIFNYNKFLSVIPSCIGPKLHICNVFYWKANICYMNLTWKNFLQPHLKAKVLSVSGILPFNVSRNTYCSFHKS